MSRITIAVFVLALLPGSLFAQEQANSAAFHSVALAEMYSSEARAADTDTRSGAPDTEAPAPVRNEARPALEPLIQTYVRPVLQSDAQGYEEIVATLPHAALKMFAGARFKDVIQLHWITTSEVGTVGFEIERRSQLSSDWQMIGYLRRDRSRSAQHAYTFLDQLNDGGVSFYRIRRIGIDGQALASPQIAVTPDAVPYTFDVWQHSIQPFQDYGTVAFGLDEDTEVKLSLVDRYGNTVATLLDHVKMRAGHHVIPFGTYMLGAGLHTLRITYAGGCHNLLLMNS